MMGKASTSQKKMAVRPSGRGANFLKLVQEREMSKKNEKKNHDQAKDVYEKDDENKQQSLVPCLPKDCTLEILLRLPLDSLWRSRLVCKPWFKMINSSYLADAFFQQSETVFIFLRPAQEGKSNTFCVDEHLSESKSISIFCSMVKHQKKSHMHFMEIKEGKCQIQELDICCFGRIIATCNGLVLLENTLKRGGLVVVNPVTKQLVGLPLGTLFPPENESYGFAFSPSTGEYKIVHLFRDEMRFIGCEVIAPGAESWRAVDGPSYGLFSRLEQSTVSAIGALHWMPHKFDSEYLVSMSIDDDKFHKTPLPSRAGVSDGVVEMGGFLCFVHNAHHRHIDIWILKDLYENNWIKQHRIPLGNNMGIFPLASSRNGIMLYFSRPFIMGHEDCALYVYDIELHQMSKVRIEKQYFLSNGSYFPHVNSLISWKSHKSMVQEDIM